VVGYRPSRNRTAPAWAADTTRDLQYQTLYVSAPGVPPAAASAVDALAFWNMKPHGVDGGCALFGFSSAVGPDLAFAPPRAGAWHANLTSDCANVNLAVPWSRFALSDDGAVAVAWTQAAAGDVTVYALDGRTGAERWRRGVPCAPRCDYFLALGADVSPDGAWVVFDEGVAGAGAHRLHVLSAATGAPRSAPVESAGAIPAHASAGAEWLLTSDDAGSPSSGAFSTWRWRGAAGGGAYARVGGGAPPLSSRGNGWTLAQYAFSTEGNATWLGVVWVDSTLLGPSVLALFDAASPGACVTSAHTEPLPGSDYANAGAVVDCAGDVCAAGFFTQKVGGPQRTLVAVAGSAPGQVWNFTTPGSVDSVSVARREGGGAFVLAAGCASVGVCTEPGGDAYGFEVGVVP
jgi:hypothetical protein